MDEELQWQEERPARPDTSVDSRIASLEAEVRRLSAALAEQGNRAASLPDIPPLPAADAADEPDGAESPPCMEMDSEMRLSPDVWSDGDGPRAWKYSPSDKEFKNPFIILGRTQQAVGSTMGNANITAAGDYWLHIEHPSTASGYNIYLVVDPSSIQDDDVNTWIFIATLAGTTGNVRQTAGIYSAPTIYLYD